MKTYLSFGGGVNSVAMYLLMLDQKMDFEAVFVDHGADYPETYEYIEIFKKTYPLTVIKPILYRKWSDKTYRTLIDYCDRKKNIPIQWPRWCTGDWKKDPFAKYIQKPCFTCIGIDAGESKRAKLSFKNGQEFRYPLIEHDIDRDGCKKIIKGHGLPIPPKSGCFICPFQRPDQWRYLRMHPPDLFCLAQRLEKQSGRTFRRGKTLAQVIDEKQRRIFEQDEYPPCHCEL